MSTASLELIIQLRDEASAALGAIGGGLDGLGKSMLGIASGAVVGLAGGFAALAAKGVSLNASMEQTSTAFTTLLGSGEAAAVFLKDLQSFAASTPFEFPELAGASQKLLAMGFASEQVIPLMTDIGNAVGALGGGQAEIDRVTMALGQMQAKGKTSNEELLQLAELGIPIYQMLADKLGVSTAEVQKMVSDGLVPANVAIEAFQEGSQNMFGGAMQAQAATFNGLMSTLKDNIGLALMAFSGPIFGMAKGALEQLGAAVSSPAFQQFAQTMGSVVGDALSALVNIASGAVSAVTTFAQALMGSTDAFQSLGPAAQSVVSALQVVGQVFMDIANQAVAWGANIFNQVAAGMMSAVGPIIDAISSIGSVIAGLLMPGSPPAFLPDLDTWGTGAANAYMEGWGAADYSVFNSISDSIKSALDGIAKASGDKGMNVAGILLGSQDEIARAVEEVRQFGSVSEATFNSIVEAAGPAGPQVSEIVRAYLDLQAATQDVATAQQELNDVTAAYAAQLDPLNAQLKGIQSQKQAIQDQQRLAKLYEEAGAAAEGSAEKQIKLLEIQELETKMKIRATEQERDVAVNASKAKLEAAKQEQAQAKTRVDQQKAMIDQQNKTNALISEQSKAMAAVGGAVKAAGGAMAGAAAATKPLADAVQGVNQTIGAVRQNVDTARAALASMGATVTSVVAPPMEWLRGVITGLMGAAAGIAVVLGAPVVWSALGAALGVVGTALSLVASAVAFLISPIGLLLIAAGALGAAITTNFMGIGTLAQNLMGIFAQFGTVISAAFAAFQSGGLTAALSVFGTGLANIGAQLLAWGAQAGVILLQIGQAFVSWIAPLIPIVLAQLQTWGAAILNWIISEAPILLTQFMLWGQSLVAWIAPYIPIALAALAELGTSILGWISAQAAPLLASFSAWASSVVAWIPGAIVSFLGAWPGMLGGFLDWIAGAVGPILAQLGTWAIAFVQWILPMLPPFLAGLGGLLGALLAFIVETAVVIASKVVVWAASFLGWIAANVLPALPGLLATILTSILSFIGGAVAGITLGVAGWGVALLAWVKDVVPKIPGALASILKSIISWITGINPTILDAALDLGKNIIDGIISGVKSAGSALFGALKDMASGALSAAKSALGIASPSKVMAQEIGAPIVDGIVAGLVQRSPKAVQAMLDLASSMFDVVSKGVEAFGKLTQLGTIPQSAILNFSDAIQRTLTEFAERMRAWDKAAMSAASQFTYKAGQVVEFLTKGVELLTGIANLAMPSQGAISAFADAMAWVMREIARVSTFDLRLGLTAAVEFASGAKAVLETISIGVTALNSLADFVKPAPGMITQFTNVIYWLVSRFVLVGQAFAGQALGAAAAFAQAAGQVFAVVSSGVDALLKLAEFVKPAPGVITTFSNVLYWLVSRFVAVAQAISGPALTAAATFADGAGKVIGIIGAGVDGLLKLAEFVRPAPGAIQTFANVVYWLVSRFVEVAAAIGQRGVAAAAAFADGAGKVLGLLKSGVEGLNALNTLAAPTYEAMAAFSMAVDQVVALLAMAADDVGQKATDAAAKFAEGAGKVLGILKSGVEGLNAINGLIQPSYDALAAFSMAVDQIVWFMSMAAEDVSQKATDAAAKFAEGAGKVLSILKSGVEGLNALGTLVAPTYDAMAQFSLVVDQIVWFMYMAAEDVSLKATEAAAKFAEGAGKVLSMVGAGVDALSKLVEFVAPAEANVSAFFRSLADLLEKMGTWAGDFDAKAFEVTGAFAAGVQKSVAGIGAAADALGKLVEFVAPSTKHVSAFFAALANLLTHMKTQAAAFDLSLFETTTAFAAGVNASVAPLKGAIESLGKFADFVPPAQKGVSAFFVSVGALLSQMGVLAGQYSAEFFAGTILFAQNIAKSVESIKAAFAQMAGLADLKGIASGVLTSFTSSLTALLGELERQVAPTAENIGAALVFGIADGIQAQMPYLVATLQNAAYTMVDTVQTALGIASPSKVFEQIGQYAGQGMAGGMAAMQPALAGAGAGLGMAAVGGAGAAVSGRAGGSESGAGLSITFGERAIVLNGVQGGVGEKELRRLAQLIKEEIANERGER